jgi:hypothetical protein
VGRNRRAYRDQRHPEDPLDTGAGLHIVTAMRRRPDITPEQYGRHAEDHAKYIVATQGMSRHVANRVIDEWHEVEQPPIDGLVEVWFPSIAHKRACFSDPLMTGIQQEHNRVFIDTRSFSSMQAVDAEQRLFGERSQPAPAAPAGERTAG